MIVTNKFEATFNLENIDKDFDIFAVEKPTWKLEKTNVLDLATQEYKARAVCYTWGAKAFVLFNKDDVSEYDYRKAITAEYPDITVRKVDIETEDFFFQKRMLLQLLMNSIRVPKQMPFTYNNLTGRLYYGDSSWITRDKKTKKPYMMYFLEVVFDPGLYLNLNVKTFMTKYGKSNGGYYVIDKKSGMFRRKLATDPFDENVFIPSSISRNTVPYLEFDSIEKFQRCKLGVMEKVLEDVRKYLGDYVKLEPVMITEVNAYEESKKEKETLSVGDYSSLLIERGVNITDLCCDESSKEMCAFFVQEFKRLYGITVETGPMKKGMYNIRLIHKADYYDEYDKADPHKEDLHGFIVQHMTVEEVSELLKVNSKGDSAVFQKVVNELIIKGDVRSGRISIYNWPALSSGKVWTFVSRDKCSIEDDKQMMRSRYNRFYRYTLLTIDKAGNLSFRQFEENNADLGSDEYTISKRFDEYDTIQRKKHQKTVEYLVYSDISNIHAIIHTNRKTMPDIRNIYTGLKETNVKGTVLTKTVIDGLAAFVEAYPNAEKYAESVKEQVQEMGLTIKKGKLKSICNMRSTVGKRFNRFLHEHYDIWMYSEIRDSDFEEDYLLSNVTDIKYYMDYETDGEKVASFNYFVGPKRKGMQTSICNACIIRQVQAEREIEFKELLPLMAVDFVCVGKYTVLPFPFKYLREYKNML